MYWPMFQLMWRCRDRSLRALLKTGTTGREFIFCPFQLDKAGSDYVCNWLSGIKLTYMRHYYQIRLNVALYTVFLYSSSYQRGSSGPHLGRRIFEMCSAFIWSWVNLELSLDNEGAWSFHWVMSGPGSLIMPLVGLDIALGHQWTF